MTYRKAMSVPELLSWAHEETQYADGMERMLPDLPEELHDGIRAQIRAHRDRAQWLDMQVEIHLNRMSPDE